MKTSDCKRADANAAPPDPRKHVNYIQGMVLGVDDLIQEFAYHQNQRQWLARDSIGYGTLSGLRVTLRNDLKVSVTPGTALSPKGQLIRVTPEQCAGINDWLDLADTKEKIKNLGNRFNVYVVLCFRDCKVDELPVPGEPCRCEDQAMAPSRILDDFRLELRLSPPDQKEEEALRDFVQWLRGTGTAGVVDVTTDREGVLRAIHQAAVAAAKDPSETRRRLREYLLDVSVLASPPGSPPDALDSVPPSPSSSPEEELCEYLRIALKLWVVELRPLWQAQWAAPVGGGCDCHGDEQTKGADAEECLLLAALAVTLTGGRVVNATDVVVDDSRRPFVVHLRMLQEMLLCGPCCGGGCNDRTFATIFALNDHTLRIWIHHPLPVTFGSDAVQLEIDDTAVSDFTLTQVVQGGSPSGATLNLFDLDLGASPPALLQHLQRITIKLDTRLMIESTSPARTLGEAILLDGSCYPDLANGIAQVFGTAELPALDDLADVNTAAAQEGDVLTRQGGQWVAAAPSTGGGRATDHGVLTGLGDDDHPQYHNDARGDLRYAPINHSHNHGSLTGLDADDHRQYLLVNGARALTGNLSAGKNKVTDLAAATKNGDAVQFEQAIKIGDAAGGDLKDTYPNPKVQKLQGRSVEDKAPTDGQVLTWNNAGTQWEPRSVLHVSTGAVRFEDVVPGDFRESPLIDSKIDEGKFAIILAVTGMESTNPSVGLNSANFNDLDTMPPPYSSQYPINLPAPFLVASYEQKPASGRFLISLRDSRVLRQQFGDAFRGPINWDVRWWAIPHSLELPLVLVPRPAEVFAVNPDILLAVLATAPTRELTVAKLAANFHVSVADLEPVLNRLRTQNLIKRTGTTITRL